jgi:hypothetical protein
VNVLKCDFGDVDEKIFHDVERTFGRIFFILGFQKIVFDGLFSDVVSGPMTLRTHNLHSEGLKKNLVK